MAAGDRDDEQQSWMPSEVNFTFELIETFPDCHEYLFLRAKAL